MIALSTKAPPTAASTCSKVCATILPTAFFTKVRGPDNNELIYQFCAFSMNPLGSVVRACLDTPSILFTISSGSPACKILCRITLKFCSPRLFAMYSLTISWFLISISFKVILLRLNCVDCRPCPNPLRRLEPAAVILMSFFTSPTSCALSISVTAGPFCSRSAANLYTVSA